MGKPLLLFVLLASASVGCSDDSDMDTDGGDASVDVSMADTSMLDLGGVDTTLAGDGAGACHTPTTSNGSLSNEWQAVNEVKTEHLTAPSDPGGGTLRLEVITSEVKPQIQAGVTGETGGIATDNGNDGVTAVTFEVGPGVQLDIGVKAVSGPTVWPQSYQVQWTFTGRKDCYEPNDTAAEAKPIPLGQEVTAMLLQNRGSSPHNLAEHSDWYSFSLDATREVKLEVKSYPSDPTFNFAFYDSNEAGVPGGVWKEADGTPSLTIPSLPAGDYLLAVTTGSFASASGSAVGIDPLPDHFQTPYVFRVTAQ